MSISSCPAYATVGGMVMNSFDLWTAFLETGAPELYLMYAKARRQEENNVSDDPGSGASSHGLQ